MQIVGLPFTNLPDIHRLAQQPQSVHLVGSQVSNPTEGSGGVEDTRGDPKETLLIKPQSTGEQAREPSKKSAPCLTGAVQSDQSHENSQVTHSQYHERCLRSSVI